jgi:K+-sensing histidine kinase KdpD
MPLAQRAIHDHGGELEVLDRPGGGARFVVHLPVDAPEADADGRPDGAAHAAHAARRRDA